MMILMMVIVMMMNLRMIMVMVIVSDMCLPLACCSAVASSDEGSESALRSTATFKSKLYSHDSTENVTENMI